MTFKSFWLLFLKKINVRDLFIANVYASTIGAMSEVQVVLPGDVSPLTAKVT